MTAIAQSVVLQGEILAIAGPRQRMEPALAAHGERLQAAIGRMAKRRGA